MTDEKNLLYTIGNLFAMDCLMELQLQLRDVLFRFSLPKTMKTAKIQTMMNESQPYIRRYKNVF